MNINYVRSLFQSVSHNPHQYTNKVYFPNTLKACSLACGRVLSGKRLVLRDREPEPRDRSGQFFEIRSWSAGVRHGHRGHRAVRHGLYGGRPASSFQNAVTDLLLDIRCSPDHYLDL